MTREGVDDDAYVPRGIVIGSGTCLDNCRNLDKFPTSYAETHVVYYSVVIVGWAFMDKERTGVI